MGWQELQLVVNRGDVEASSQALFTLGCQGLQEDYLPGETPAPRQPWDTGSPPPSPRLRLLRAWFEDPDMVDLSAKVAPFAAGAEPVWAPIDETDWQASFEDGFVPIVVSERLVVAPPWNAPEGALIIEPGSGFGTGQHTTTRQCLEALDRLVDKVDTVLDLGCGSGILALAAMKLGKQAQGVDVDEAAIRDAHAQAATNALPAPFSTTPVSQLTEPADLVLANLFAEALLGMSDDLVRLTGRWLVLAGILADREHLIRDVLDPQLELLARSQDGEWVCLHYGRRA